MNLSNRPLVSDAIEKTNLMEIGLIIGLKVSFKSIPGF